MLSENIKHKAARAKPNFLCLNLYKNHITNVDNKRLKQYANDVYMYKRITTKVGVSTKAKDVKITDTLLFKSNKSTINTAVSAAINMQRTVFIVGIAIN